MPTRNGSITRVNLAEAMAQVEPYFLVEEDVQFELYTLNNKITPQVLSMDNVTSITASNFNKNVPTRIYIHGFLEYGGNMKRLFNDGKLIGLEIKEKENSFFVFFQRNILVIFQIRTSVILEKCDQICKHSQKSTNFNQGRHVKAYKISEKTFLHGELLTSHSSGLNWWG